MASSNVNENSTKDNSEITYQRLGFAIWSAIVAIFLLLVSLYMIGYILGPKTDYYDYRNSKKQIINTIYINPMFKDEEYKDDQEYEKPKVININARILYKNGQPCVGKIADFGGGKQKTSSIVDKQGGVVFSYVDYGTHTISVKNKDGTIIGQCSFETLLSDDGTLDVKFDNSEFQTYKMQTRGNIIYLEIELYVDEETKSVSAKKDGLTYLTENGKLVTPNGVYETPQKEITITPNGASVASDGTVVIVNQYENENIEIETIIITQDGDVIVRTKDKVTVNGVAISEGQKVKLESGAIIDESGNVITTGGTVITPKGEVTVIENQTSSGNVVSTGQTYESEETNETNSTNSTSQNSTNSNPISSENTANTTVGNTSGQNTSNSTTTSISTSQSVPTNQTTASGTTIATSQNGSTTVNTSVGTSTSDTNPSYTTTATTTGSNNTATSSNTSTTSNTHSSTTASGSSTNVTQSTNITTSRTTRLVHDGTTTGIVTVYEEDVAWSQLSTIDIFTDVQNLAPGSQGSYIFRLVNTNSFGVNFTFHITEREHEVSTIPLLYKLKKGSQYIAGSAGDDGWVTTDFLGDVQVPLDPRCDIEYELEWKWMFESGDDERDTNIGGAVNLIHRFDFRVLIEQM